MSIHFAAAESLLRPRLSPTQARAALVRPANDNGGDAEASQAMLHAALRQFAQHGIGAAAHARNQAENAFFAGDRETYQWWLGVCRTLDRRMAAGLDDRSPVDGGAKPR